MAKPGQEPEDPDDGQMVELRSRVSEEQQVHQDARRAYSGIQGAQPSLLEVPLQQVCQLLRPAERDAVAAADLVGHDAQARSR